MKRFVIAAAVAAFIPAVLAAQSVEDYTVEGENEFDVRARAAVGMDYKIIKGLHVSLQEQVRFKENLSEFSSSYSTLEVSYKPLKYLKVGAEAIYIAQRHPDADTEEGDPLVESKYRFGGYLTGMYTVGGVQLSLRELFQSTTRTKDINNWQEPQTKFELKSKFKVSYPIKDKHIEPYIYEEARNIFNAVNYQYIDGSPYISYNDVYFNRFRTGLGCTWDISKKHSVDFYTMLDYNRAKDIDTTAKGKLKSITLEHAYALTFGITYTFGL